MDSAPSAARVSVARAAIAQAAVIGILAAAAAWFTIALDLKWRPPSAVRTIPVAEASPRPADFVWVDVRNLERFENAHIPGAIHFDEAHPEPALEAIKEAQRARRRLVVYGEGIGSDRAERVARLLLGEFPKREVCLLEGGWAAWPRP